MSKLSKSTFKEGLHSMQNFLKKGHRKSSGVETTASSTSDTLKTPSASPPDSQRLSAAAFSLDNPGNIWNTNEELQEQPHKELNADKSRSRSADQEIVHDGSTGDPQVPGSSFQKEKSQAFKDSTIAIAVDISSSTRGLVIQEELSAIRTISKGLDPQALGQSHVLPWDDSSRAPVKMDAAIDLQCGLGTHPSSLLRDYGPSTATSKLRACSLWFLLTDGEISNREVRKFASSLTAQAVHGTPCILVIFGYRPTRPNACEISVGVSVFGIAPDCVFLFHDVHSGVVYVLQYKGCFKLLFQDPAPEIFLDDETTWDSLPRIRYSDLFGLNIPVPDPVTKDEIILQSRSRIKLDDLYNNRLRPEEIEDIFANDDNLKSLLLTTVTRGQADQMEGWIEKQRDGVEDFSTISRPDIGGRASTLIKKLLHLSDQDTTAGDHHQEEIELRAELRQAHHDNWSAFKGLVQLHRAKLGERHMKVTGLGKKLVQVKSDSATTARSMGSVYGEGEEEERAAYVASQPEPTMSGLLYNKCFTAGKASNTISGRCSICKFHGENLALLLQEPPSGLPTAGFPIPDSHTTVLYPLSMANFRETDIISRLVCCDPCSVLLVNTSSIVQGEKIVAALPLVPWMSDKSNKKSWFQIVDDALQRRFDRSDLPLIFSGLLYNALDQFTKLDTPDAKLFARSIQSACRELGYHTEIPFSMADLHKKGSIHDVVTHCSQNLADSSQSLLRYPLDSFLLLIRIAFPEEPLDTASIVTLRYNENITILVFQRLLLHIIEQHLLFQEQEGPEKAFENLASAIKKIDRYPEEPAGSTKPALAVEGDGHEPTSTSVFLSLVEKALIESDALAGFQRLGDLFGPIEWTSGPAISRFLVNLLHMDVKDTDPLLVYKKLTRDKGVIATSCGPHSVSQAEFMRLVTVREDPPLDQQ